MSRTHLLLANLLYHLRGNLAVMLGVAVGTAVLTGGLLVGDSLRGSLRDRTLDQLAWVDDALVAGRFVRQDLAADLARRSPGSRVAPVLLLRAAASTRPADPSSLPRRAGRVTVLGVDDTFWTGPPPVAADFWQPSKPPPAGDGSPDLVLNHALARELHVAPGDRLVLHLQKHDAGAPRESLLGRRDADDVAARQEWTVRAVLPPDAPGANFSLIPSPADPRTVFVPLSRLQQALGTPGRVNALFAAGLGDDPQASLQQALTLQDWGLEVFDPETRWARLDRDSDGRLSSSECQGRLPPELTASLGKRPPTRDEVLAWYRQRGYLSLESPQVFLEPAVVDAALRAAPAAGLRAAPTLVYLANSLSDGANSIPYSVVAALDPSLPPPLGPFLPPGQDKMADDDIVLADWKDSPIQAPPGSPITLTFFPPDPTGPPKARTASFRLLGRIPLAGLADDPDLAPEFPGITDKTSVAEWDPPSAFDRRDIQKQVKRRDEDYWKQHRTAPKAYVTLARGQELWGSRFGRATSVRLAPADGTAADLSILATQFREALLRELPADQGGLVFDPVRRRALEASTGGTDFSSLFLGFSFFLIVAALLLVSLLFRLNLDRRAREIGVMLATGYRLSAVRRLLLAEGAVLAILGGLLGTLLALLYTRLLLTLLAVLWPGGLDRSFLQPHVTARSLLIGFFASLAVSLLTILWSLRALGRVSPRALLAGQGAEAAPDADPVRAGRLRWIVALASAAGAALLLLLTRFVHGHEAQAMTFFGSAALALTAALALFWAWMRGPRHRPVHGAGPAALARLGLRNATRFPLRSLLTTALLASAVFLLVAVELFRRHAADDFNQPNSGSGGFALLAESSVPVFDDLAGPRGQNDILESLERHLQSRFPDDPARVQDELRQARTLLDQVQDVPIRVRAGDDASCLNLYQPRRPQLLGVPRRLIDRGGFRFAASLAETEAEKTNPWLLLDRRFPDGAIPVIGDANSVTWILKSTVGQDLPAVNERGEPVQLRIVATLQDSIFQNGLLLAEDRFLTLFPGHEGYQLFLVAAPPGRADDVKSLLDTALADRGLETTTAVARLESYLAVENTYLSTFQALGALGLVLGSLGLAVVLVRTVWERRGELALLRSLGYRHRALGWLLLSENAFLLTLGLALGVAAALIAVAPHLAGPGGLSWTRLVLLPALVLLVGLATAALALAGTLRTPLLPALRRE